jgi:hypothetical protein
MSERNISDAIEAIRGKKPSPEDIQRLESIFFNLGFEKGDTFRPFLMVLDAYHGFYSKLPAELNQAADNAANSAAIKAQSAVNEAVAKLLPSISKDISKQTNEAIQTVQENQSLKIKGIWFSVIATGVLCLFLGGRYVGIKQATAEIRAQDNSELVWLHSGAGKALAECSSPYVQYKDGWCETKSLKWALPQR